MKKTYTADAHAKINLFLEVLDRRADGYHTIESIMQTVTLCDTVTVSLSDGEGISLSCSNASLPTDGHNLAVRAAEAFLHDTGLTGRVDIHLEKRIPVAAGLAGGSTDAAAVLTAMNALTGAGLDRARLCTIGARLGADVPFCVRGGTALARGIGEILTDIAPMPECALVIAIGDGGISTRDAYEKIDALSDRPRRDVAVMQRALEGGAIADVRCAMFNIFEQTTDLHGEAVQLLRANGADAAMMSGSGPSVFGIFDDEASAESACRALRSQGLRAYCCKPWWPTEKIG